MAFQSILFRNAKDGTITDAIEAPTFFGDFNLDQIVDAVTAGKKEYNLKPFYFTPLRDLETISYRHGVMRDLKAPDLMGYIKAFAEKMSIVRRYLGLVEKLDFNYQKKGWFNEAVLVYCDAITILELNLSLANMKSHGLLAFREYVMHYVQSDGFQSLLAEAQKVRGALSQAKYCVIIQSDRFRVRRYAGETDYSAEVEKVFEKFKRGAAKDYRAELAEPSGMNHIEAKILEFVVLLYPEECASTTFKDALFLSTEIMTRSTCCGKPW